MQSEVIAHDHRGHLEEQGEDHQSALHTYVERLSLVEAASGDALETLDQDIFLGRFDF